MSLNSISTCMKCKISFRNPSNTPWCISCTEDMQWVGPSEPKNKTKNDESNQNSQAGINTKMTPSTELENLQNKKNGTSEREKSFKPDQEIIIIRTEKLGSQQELSGTEIIRKDKMRQTENITKEIKRGSKNLSMLPEIAGIPSEELQENSINLGQEVSHSISSLNASGKELFSLMRGLRSDLPETAVRLYEPDRVQTAVACAHQIVNTMKMKLELLKFHREVTPRKVDE